MGSGVWFLVLGKVEKQVNAEAGGVYGMVGTGEIWRK